MKKRLFWLLKPTCKDKAFLAWFLVILPALYYIFSMFLVLVLFRFFLSYMLLSFWLRQDGWKTNTFGNSQKSAETVTVLGYLFVLKTYLNMVKKSLLFCGMIVTVLLTLLTKNHSVIKLFCLEETFKIMKFNCSPYTSRSPLSHVLQQDIYVL